MSEIRDYLEEKSALPENEWLKREPRETLPAILDAVRAFRATTRVAYNDEAEQVVERLAGDLPEHHYHADPRRHRLTERLGHEVYIAQCVCHDEENLEQAAQLRAQGFVPLEEAPQGERFDVALGTIYSGYQYPSYGRVKERCRVFSREPDGRWVFLPYRARNNGFYGSPQTTLVRAVAA